MDVEIYIGFGQGSGTWVIYDVNVPDTLYGKNDLIEDYISVWMDEPARNFDENVAFWGIYYIPELVIDDDD